MVLPANGQATGPSPGLPLLLHVYCVGYCKLLDDGVGKEKWMR